MPGPVSASLQSYLQISNFGDAKTVFHNDGVVTPLTNLSSTSREPCKQEQMAQIAVFLLYLSTEAVPRPGTYPYPPIVGVGGAHGTIARARSTLRRGDLGLDRCFHCGRGGAETAATLPGGGVGDKSINIQQNRQTQAKPSKIHPNRQK